MNAGQVNVFLTKAALVDPRMKRVDPTDQADMATAWAELLDDVDLQTALKALREHYRTSGDPITPARVVELAGIQEPSKLPDLTAAFVEESKARALAAAGVTEEEWAAHAHDRAWIEARFNRAIEEGR